MPKVKRGLRLGLLAALFASIGFGAALAKPPVWTVRSGHATLVIFGSIHLLPAGLDWRPPALDAALQIADEVWFELPITPQSDAKAAAESQSLGQLPAPQRLSDLLSAEELEKLQAAAAKVRCVPEALDRMRPWMAELTLSLAEDAQMGANASDGVEEQVQAVAPPSVKRRAFETAAQQIRILSDAPLKDQLASLNWTVREIEEDPDSYRRVVDAWMAGDLEALEREAVEPLATISPALYQRLLIRRNHQWVARLRQRLRRPGVFVVVVGVGHLVGDESVPQLLRAAGLSVEGP
jgi:uncharacterized protein YbaP (TraB family)